MKKWKYKIEPFLTVDLILGAEIGVQTQLLQEDKFNLWGDCGWELVAIHEVGEQSSREKYAVFKKEKKEIDEKKAKDKEIEAIEKAYGV
ncbi:MAG: hypothetical protein ACKVJA_04595 [Flavobacteriales bacterium]